MLITSLTKRYSDTAVLDDVSFDFKQGEIVGLVGSNGAGKSTLMKIIAKTISTFDGSVKDNDHVGYLIEEPKLFRNKTGLAHLSYFSEIYGNKFELRQYEDILKRLKLYDVLNKKVKEYSLGMKQKLGIIISLLNRPNYVILDEPTNSMDIETSLEVLKMLRLLANEQNVGILISSHKLEDIETICDRFIFLEKGNVIGEQQFSNDNQVSLKLVFENLTDLEKFSEHQEFGSIIEANNTTILIDTKSDNSEVFKFLNQLGIRLIDFTAEKKTLRNFYMNKFRGEHNDTKY